MTQPSPAPARPERRGVPVRPPLRLDAPGRPAPPPGARAIKRRGWFTLWVILLGGVCLFGLPYYEMTRPERVRSPLHPWLKPAGYIGQSAGILALLIFLFLWLYPLRKKFRWLSFTGTMAKWLDTHVLSALALPLLVAIHSAWRFEGLIGLGFWSMMVVWASGIVGRYVYSRIPRGKAGVEMTIEEIAAQRKDLIEEISKRSGLDAELVAKTLSTGMSTPAKGGVGATLYRMIRDDFARRRGARALRRLWKERGWTKRKADRKMIPAMLQLARREMALGQQARMLSATHAVFRYWHVLHRPVAIAALVAVIVHVAVVVALGATWLW